jgi:hypothetical protein
MEWPPHRRKPPRQPGVVLSPRRDGHTRRRHGPVGHLAIASTDQLATFASRQACHLAQLVRHILQSGCADGLDPSGRPVGPSRRVAHARAGASRLRATPSQRLPIRARPPRCQTRLHGHVGGPAGYRGRRARSGVAGRVLEHQHDAPVCSASRSEIAPVDDRPGVDQPRPTGPARCFDLRRGTVRGTKCGPTEGARCAG